MLGLGALASATRQGEDGPKTSPRLMTEDDPTCRIAEETMIRTESCFRGSLTLPRLHKSARGLIDMHSNVSSPFKSPISHSSLHNNYSATQITKKGTQTKWLERRSPIQPTRPWKFTTIGTKFGRTT